jgi:hypothetical protein
MSDRQVAAPVRQLDGLTQERIGRDLYACALAAPI